MRCERCASTEMVDRYTVMEDAYVFCADCAAVFGFCYGCGYFIAGSGEETHIEGMCYECLEEMKHELGEYDDNL